MELSALSDEQINVKFAKLLRWKLVDGKWWHDDLGDGPPMNYCGQFGRSLVQEIVTNLLNNPSVPNVTEAMTPPGKPKDQLPDSSVVTSILSGEKNN